MIEEINFFFLCCIIALSVFGTRTYAENEDSQWYTIADSMNCLSKAKGQAHAFGALPVYGWDNLRNSERGMVMDVTYKSCKLSEDGDYLLPDNINVIPIKTSRVTSSAKLISNLNEYTSLTSRSININAGLNYKGVGVSGKFSTGYQRAKSWKIGTTAAMARVDIRYLRYDVKLQPNSPVHPSFKSAVLRIAEFIQLNQTDSARYYSDLLVKNYGTHFLNGLTVGATLVKEDTFEREFIENMGSSRSDFLTEVGVSLFIIANIGVSVSSSNSQSMRSTYQRAVKTSSIMTHGGPVYTFSNTTVKDWSSSVDNHLVALDRTGEPIFYLINSLTFPEIPASVVHATAALVEGAVECYYEYNTHPGCMDPTSPNYVYSANLDDGSCLAPLSNLTFGGVYVECQHDGQICQDYQQRNPKTDSYSCPKNYKPVLLHSTRVYRSRPRRHCYSCGFLWLKTCCDLYYYPVYSDLFSYWCFANDTVASQSGYLFGGYYSSNDPNMFTGHKSCPPFFYARRLGQNLYICLSDYFALGSKSAVPFGGMFSCRVGNPLVVDKTMAGKVRWPKACPKGFSAHLLTMENGCALHVCLSAKTVSAVMPIRLPPFMSEPAPLQLTNDPEFLMVDEAMPEKLTSNQDDSTPSSSSIALVAVGSSLFVVSVALLIYTARKKIHVACKSIRDSRI